MFAQLFRTRHLARLAALSPRGRTIIDADSIERSRGRSLGAIYAKQRQIQREPSKIRHRNTQE